jgi:hypothetical protein
MDKSAIKSTLMRTFNTETQESVNSILRQLYTEWWPDDACQTYQHFKKLSKFLEGEPSADADPRSWVFPQTGTADGRGDDFKELCAKALRSAGQMPLPEFDTSLYSSHPWTGVFVSDPENEIGATRKFIATLCVAGAFFSLPSNLTHFSVLVRQFMSNYCGSYLLEGIDPDLAETARLLERGIMESCPGCRAQTTDLLRMIYNASTSTCLTLLKDRNVDASIFGHQGRTITLLCPIRPLIENSEREEKQADKDNLTYYLNRSKGEVFLRPWYRLKVKSERPPSNIYEAMELDRPRYLPSVDLKIGSRYNTMKLLGEIIVMHCEEASAFSLTRLYSRMQAVLDTAGISAETHKSHGSSNDNDLQNAE